MFVNYRIPGDALRKFNQIRNKYVSYFFLLTYLVLPSVTTTIFQIFICTDVDPNNEDPDQNDLYLAADMSISCTSTYYYNGVLYAAMMILVYPIGVPCLYYYLLYCGRDELKHRNDKPDEVNAVEESPTENPLNSASLSRRIRSVSSESSATKPKTRTGEKLSVPVTRISFLWEAYQPQFWYWEIIETTRRLMLTAVLSVAEPGTTGQTVFAVVLAVMYIKLYGLFGPYTSTEDNMLSETGQYQIYFTFFCALIMQGALLGKEWDDVLGVFLVFINLSVFIYILKVEFDLYHATKGIEIEEEEEVVVNESDSDDEDMYSLSMVEGDIVYEGDDSYIEKQLPSPVPVPLPNRNNSMKSDENPLGVESMVKIDDPLNEIASESSSNDDSV